MLNRNNAKVDREVSRKRFFCVALFRLLTRFRETGATLGATFPVLRKILLIVLYASDLTKI